MPIPGYVDLVGAFIGFCDLTFNYSDNICTGPGKRELPVCSFVGLFPIELHRRNGHRPISIGHLGEGCFDVQKCSLR